jgi:hypothetical protein
MTRERHPRAFTAAPLVIGLTWLATIFLPAASATTTAYVPFSDNSYWNTPLKKDAPVNNWSADIIAYLKSDNSPDYVQLSGTGSDGEWGNPVYWAAKSDHAYRIKNETGCPDLPSEMSSMRIPAGAKADPTDDASMTVYDLTRGVVYALWQASYSSSTDTWTSCGGSVYYVGSNGLAGSLPQSDEPRNQGHRGVPPSTFAVRWDEIQAGEIDHVLKIAVDTTKCRHVFPMTGDECGTTNKNAPSEGARIRIKRSIDVTKLGLSAAALVIAKALQTYGAIIADQSSGSASLKVENVVAEGRGWLWKNVLDVDSLSKIPFGDYEVMQIKTPG